MRHKSEYIDWAKANIPSLDENELAYLFDDLTRNSSLNLKIWSEAIHRLFSGEPLQYISGIAHFYGYVFNVNSDVLIPRPETEELVFKITQLLNKGTDNTTILDIGTGSGCIPISLKKEIQNTRITSIDVSEDALRIARANAEKLQAEVEFKCIDFTDENTWSRLGTYDVIVSNPPYIPNREKALMFSNVLDYEPHLALFVEDDDPLLFYRFIALFSKKYLNSNGIIALELNEYNANEVRELFVNDYANVEIIEDLQQKQRVLIATNA